MGDEDWQIFISAWLQAMREFQSERLTMDEAFDLTGKFSNDIDEEIEQVARNVVSEINGFPRGYAEVLTLLQNKPSGQDVLRYMNS